MNWFVLALRPYMEYGVASRSLEAKSTESADDGNDLEQFGSENLSDRDCVEICEEVFWEPTIYNLGQSYCKAERFQDASLCFEKCLALCPVSTDFRSYLKFIVTFIFSSFFFSMQ